MPWRAGETPVAIVVQISGERSGSMERSGPDDPRTLPGTDDALLVGGHGTNGKCQETNNGQADQRCRKDAAGRAIHSALLRRPLIC